MEFPTDPVAGAAGMPPGPCPCDESEGAFVYLDVRVPTALRDAAASHFHHLSQLLRTLREAGVDEQSIRQSLDVLVSRYRDELMVAVAQFPRGARYD